MLPTYKKMRATFDKAWKMTRPPFERVQIPYEGKMLDGYFRKPNGPQGKKFPVVIPFQGADTMAEATILNGGAYTARGMAYLAVDFPGQGGAMRLHDLHLPPDTDRIAKAHDRLPGDPSGRGCHAGRDAGHQHGRLRRAACRKRGEENQGRDDEQRFLRFEVGPVRILSADSGARALDHRRKGSGRRPQEARRIQPGRRDERPKSKPPC